MPERVTPEERLVSLAIEKARKAAEVLRQREPTQVKEVEHEAEEVKVKKPKVQADKTKIKTQSEETHSGYGLAGQEIKKKVPYDIDEFYTELLDHIRSLSMDVKDFRKLESKLESYGKLSPGQFEFYNGEVRTIRAHIDSINEFKNHFQELPKSFLE